MYAGRTKGQLAGHCLLTRAPYPPSIRPHHSITTCWRLKIQTHILWNLTMHQNIFGNKLAFVSTPASKEYKCFTHTNEQRMNCIRLVIQHSSQPRQDKDQTGLNLERNYHNASTMMISKEGFQPTLSLDLSRESFRNLFETRQHMNADSARRNVSAYTGETHVHQCLQRDPNPWFSLYYFFVLIWHQVNSIKLANTGT